MPTDTITRRLLLGDLAALGIAFLTPYLLMRGLDWRPFGTVVGAGFWAVTSAILVMSARYRMTGRSLATIGLGRPASFKRSALVFAARCTRHGARSGP